MLVAILQARMGSSRLAGKTLMPILGVPLISRMLERVQRAQLIDRIIVATTTDSSDDPIAQTVTSLGVEVFRGHPTDVLQRYYEAAKGAHADTIVRITGDCPLHDPAVLDEVVAHFEVTNPDYCSGPSNYPEGLDTEVFSFAALETACKEARLPSEREHVTPYIHNHPELFTIALRWRSGERDDAKLHWSVDSKGDLIFVSAVYAELYPMNPAFGKNDVLALLERKPVLLQLNAGGTGYEGLAKSLREDEAVLKKDV